MVDVLGFNKKKKLERERKEAIRAEKIAVSQNALLASAIATADAAQEVTGLLKNKLEEIVEQFNQTARILKDALVICDANGSITYFNLAAEHLFHIGYKDALGKSILDFFKASDGTMTNVGELWVKLQNANEEDVLGVRADDNETFQARVGFSVLERTGGNSILLLVRDPSSCSPCPDSSRYAAIFETSFDGVVIVKDGVIVAANPACVRLFGHHTEDVMGKPVSVLVIEREKNRFLDILIGVKQSNERNFMVEGIHSTGRLLSLVFTITEVEWDGGTAALMTIRDITEMKRLEKVVTLKRDNGVDMICVFDADFRITFANQTFANSLNLKVKDIVGSDIRKIANVEDNITKITPENPYHRSHVSNNGKFEDWIDHGYFDETGHVIEYHRVGRVINEALTAAIKEY